MIEFDETEFTDDGLTAASLKATSSLIGEGVAFSMIKFDEPETQDEFTAQSLILIESLLGPEVAELLYGEVVPIDVGSSRIAV